VLHLSSFASSQIDINHQLIEIGSVRGALHVAPRVFSLAIEVLLIIKCPALIKNDNSQDDARLNEEA